MGAEADLNANLSLAASFRDRTGAKLFLKTSRDETVKHSAFLVTSFLSSPMKLRETLKASFDICPRSKEKLHRLRLSMPCVVLGDRSGEPQWHRFSWFRDRRMAARTLIHSRPECPSCHPEACGEAHQNSAFASTGWTAHFFPVMQNRTIGSDVWPFIPLFRHIRLPEAIWSCK